MKTEAEIRAALERLREVALSLPEGSAVRRGLAERHRALAWVLGLAASIVPSAAALEFFGDLER